MAKNFFDCAQNGGKVVNKKTKDGKTIKLCYDEQGKSHMKPEKKEKSKIKVKPSNGLQASLESLQKLAEHFNNKRN